MEFFDDFFNDASKLGLDIIKEKHLPSKTETIDPAIAKAYERGKQPIIVNSSPIDSKMLMYGGGGLLLVVVIAFISKGK